MVIDTTKKLGYLDETGKFVAGTKPPEVQVDPSKIGYLDEKGSFIPSQEPVKPKPLPEVPRFKAPEDSILKVEPKKITVPSEFDPNVSVEDYLVSIGQPGDYNSRVKLARDLGIVNYTGLGTQNDRLLRLLREGQQIEEEKPEVKPEPALADEEGDQQDTQQQIVNLNKVAEEEQEGEYTILTEEGGKDVEVSDSVKLTTKLIEALEDKPERDKTTLETFQEQREILGIEDLENEFASAESAVEKLDADFASKLEEEEGRKVSLKQVRRRQSAEEIAYNRKRRDLVVERNALANQLNMKYNVLNNIVKYTGQDYDDAQQDYQFKFNAALQLTNLLTGIEDKAKTAEERQIDNARANLQIMYNLFKGGNVSYESLDSATQLDIKSMELQAGLPTGFTKFIDENIKEDVVSFLPAYTNEEGNRIQPVATVTADGKYSISNVSLGKAQVKTTDIISQAKLNTLAASGIPEAVALDIQRSLNSGRTKPEIIAHLDQQLGEGKGKEMMEIYENIMIP